jgi:methionyl-tRNA formyltransferase
MTEEDVTAFEEDPGKMLPQFAARLHLQVMRAAQQGLARMLPQMVQQINQTQSQAQTLTEKFFTANQALVGHEQTVRKFGEVYRTLNPTATADDFIRDVGAQVSVALGLHQQAAPAAAVVKAPVTPPHKPAGIGANAAVTKPVISNEFEAISMEAEDD